MEPTDTRKNILKLFENMESIDNLYANGLSGDLAEVCVNQGPYGIENITVGLPGRWNNTYFPRYR